jgi:hypothetical protein
MRQSALRLAGSIDRLQVIFVVRKRFQYRNCKGVIYRAVRYSVAQYAIGCPDRFRSPGSLS